MLTEQPGVIGPCNELQRILSRADAVPLRTPPQIEHRKDVCQRPPKAARSVHQMPCMDVRSCELLKPRSGDCSVPRRRAPKETDGCHSFERQSARAQSATKCGNGPHAGSRSVGKREKQLRHLSGKRWPFWRRGSHGCPQVLHRALQLAHPMLALGGNHWALP